MNTDMSTVESTTSPINNTKSSNKVKNRSFTKETTPTTTGPLTIKKRNSLGTKVGRSNSSSSVGERSSNRRATSVICCVSDCKNGESTVKADGNCVTLFEMPERRNLRLKWFYAVPELSYVLPMHRKICQDHFVDGKPSDAKPVPTLNLGNTPPAKPQKSKKVKESKESLERSINETIDNVAENKTPKSTLQQTKAYNTTLDSPTAEPDLPKTYEIKPPSSSQPPSSVLDIVSSLFKKTSTPTRNVTIVRRGTDGSPRPVAFSVPSVQKLRGIQIKREHGTKQIVCPAPGISATGSAALTVTNKTPTVNSVSMRPTAFVQRSLPVARSPWSDKQLCTRCSNELPIFKRNLGRLETRLDSMIAMVRTIFHQQYGQPITNSKIEQMMAYSNQRSMDTKTTSTVGSSSLTDHISASTSNSFSSSAHNLQISPEIQKDNIVDHELAATSAVTGKDNGMLPNEQRTKEQTKTMSNILVKPSAVSASTDNSDTSRSNSAASAEATGQPTVTLSNRTSGISSDPKISDKSVVQAKSSRSSSNLLSSKSGQVTVQPTVTKQSRQSINSTIPKSDKVQPIVTKSIRPCNNSSVPKTNEKSKPTLKITNGNVISANKDINRKSVQIAVVKKRSADTELNEGQTAAKSQKIAEDVQKDEVVKPKKVEKYYLTNAIVRSTLMFHGKGFAVSHLREFGPLWMVNVPKVKLDSILTSLVDSGLLKYLGTFESEVEEKDLYMKTPAVTVENSTYLQQQLHDYGVNLSSYIDSFKWAKQNPYATALDKAINPHLTAEK